MEKNNIKEIIDEELQSLVFDETMKRRVRDKSVPKRFPRIFKSIAACVLMLVLGGTTVFAGYYVMNKIMVNEEELPELDTMHIVKVKSLKESPDEYGMTKANFSDYDTMKEALGIDLLDTVLSAENSYMLGDIMTDNKDFLIMEVNNYILGDTSNYEFIPEEKRYQYTHGEKYFSPVSLTVDIILSENQMNTGWETDYLGMYKFVESYTSEQGYTVNIIEDTTDEDVAGNYVSEKCAVFVADGIRYTLRGRTSIDEIKVIVNTMK